MLEFPEDNSKMPIAVAADELGLKPSQISSLTAAKEQYLNLPNTTLIADLAYPEPEFELSLKEQNTCLLVGRKKPKGKDLNQT